MWVARQDEKQREQFTTMKAQLDHTLEIYQSELADQLKYIRNQTTLEKDKLADQLEQKSLALERSEVKVADLEEENQQL